LAIQIVIRGPLEADFNKVREWGGVKKSFLGFRQTAGFRQGERGREGEREKERKREKEKERERERNKKIFAQLYENAYFLSSVGNIYYCKYVIIATISYISISVLQFVTAFDASDAKNVGNTYGTKKLLHKQYMVVLYVPYTSCRPDLQIVRKTVWGTFLITTNICDYT
jgi:hypothetical protein